MRASAVEANALAAEQRANACDNPTCVGGLVEETVRWHRPEGVVEGKLIRTCLRCSGTPSYVYYHVTE